MDLILVRHGESVGNKMGFVQGWQDTNLTPLGVAQAAAVAARLQADYLPIDAVYASPLQRAWRTAQAISRRTQLEPMVEPDLREMHFGLIEGMTQLEWRKKFPELLPGWADSDNLDFGWPGGETRGEFAARVERTMARLIAAAPYERLLVVAHGGVFSTYLSILLTGASTNWRNYHVNNCTITLLKLGAGEPQLVLFDDDAHLAGIKDERLVLQPQL